MAPPIKIRSDVRTCSNCSNDKGLNEFPSRKNSRGYLCISGRCKTCRNAESSKRAARRRAENPEAMREQDAKAYQRHKEKILTRTRARHAEIGREVRSEQAARWRANNTKKYRAQRQKREAERRASDPLYKLTTYLRGRVRRALKDSKKAGRTLELIGCSIGEVRAHLEAQFLPGMSWENHGLKGWHIDHIRPCASFDLTDPKQQRQCFHYTNLQPLWAADNLRKWARY